MLLQFPQLNLISLPRLCVTLQLTPGRLRSVAAELQLVPAMTIDDVPHYDVDDVERIRSHMAPAAPPPLSLHEFST